MKCERKGKTVSAAVYKYILYVYNYLVPRRVKKLSRSFRNIVPLNYIYILAESDGFIQQNRLQFHGGQKVFRKE